MQSLLFCEMANAFLAYSSDFFFICDIPCSRHPFSSSICEIIQFLLTRTSDILMPLSLCFLICIYKKVSSSPCKELASYLFPILMIATRTVEWSLRVIVTKRIVIRCERHCTLADISSRTDVMEQC